MLTLQTLISGRVLHSSKPTPASLNCLVLPSAQVGQFSELETSPPIPQDAVLVLHREVFVPPELKEVPGLRSDFLPVEPTALSQRVGTGPSLLRASFASLPLFASVILVHVPPFVALAT